MPQFISLIIAFVVKMIHKKDKITEDRRMII